MRLRFIAFLFVFCRYNAHMNTITMSNVIKMRSITADVVPMIISRDIGAEIISDVLIIIIIIVCTAMAIMIESSMIVFV